MPLTEQRIAHLVLRYLLKVISPDEMQELMEGYVNLSAANRLAFEKLTDRENLLSSLRDYYEFMEHPEADPEPGED